ncbi:receptor activity-modifying protein 1-like [Hypomesus transpacificus]|uniref:receptor activity-modifying protein 1-like n=1 Tax=Hypomesus transpacificus TaxID=137520 RepID=UPI001F078549|nr:receptor activity-modifying protein 1-like [Hypomesus transpacificus]
MILFLLFSVLVLGEMELPTNISTHVITEEDESFQVEQGHPGFSQCNETLLEKEADKYCSLPFDEIMMTMDKETWCDWGQVIRPYNILSVCLETVAFFVGCRYPNNGIQELFFKTHSQYFHNCYTEEELTLEAPKGVVLVLTFAPISLMIVLVFLVACKKKKD